MRKVTSFFDDILKIIAFATIVLTIAGFVDQKLFYQHFDVSINEYITASEILLSSLDQIGLVFIAVLIQMAVWLYLFNHLYDYDEQDIIDGWKPGEGRPEYHDETIHRFFTSKFLKVYGLTLMGLAIITAVASGVFPFEKWLSDIKNFIVINFWVAMCIFMGWLQSARGIWMYLKNSENYNPKIVTAFVVFFTVMLFTLWVKNNFYFNRIRKFGNSESIHLLLENGYKVIPNDSVRYAGRTQQYFFFWNKFTKETKVIPVAEVKQIIYTKDNVSTKASGKSPSVVSDTTINRNQLKVDLEIKTEKGVFHTGRRLDEKSLFKVVGRPVKDITLMAPAEMEQFASLREQQFKGITLTSYSLKVDSQSFLLKEIALTSKSYSTEKGLKIGDDISTLKRLYPSAHCTITKKNGECRISDESKKDHLIIDIKSDTVTSIKLYTTYK